MERSIVRTYAFSDREVREAIICWLRSKDLPVPQYVADTPTTKWVNLPAGISVEWTEQGEVETG